MKNKLNVALQELPSIWAFVSFITEAAAVVIIILTAKALQDLTPRMALAVVGGVLAVNLLAKIYALIRIKQ